MGVKAFDHVNIRTTNVPGTLGFFRDILGMETTPFPGRANMDSSGWILDQSGNAIIHVNTVDEVYPTDETWPWSPTRGSGAAHHVAFNCEGYDETLAQLEKHEIAYIPNEVPQISLRQLFVQDVNGITVELNFRG